MKTEMNSREATFLDTNKGVSFQRNCGAALVGEYNKKISFYQLS